MRIAIIGDIHGHLNRLQRVLAHIESENIDLIMSTGDLVDYYRQPNEVIRLLREKNILTIKGNHDEKIAKAEPISMEVLETMTKEEVEAAALFAYTRAVITEDNRKYLDELPDSLDLHFGNVCLKIVHGSYRRIDEYMHDDEGLLKAFAADMDKLEMKTDILVSGHTHIPYIRQIGSRTFINAGSVGKPKHGDHRSTYIILDIGNQECLSKISYVEAE